MNANRIISMILRMVMRKAMNRGISAGVNAMSKSDSAGRSTPQEHRGNAAQTQQNVKKAQRAARLARRMSKF